MRNIAKALGLLCVGVLLMGAEECRGPKQEDRDRKVVQSQQEQYAIGQPIPVFDWSLERNIVIELYGIRNQNVATHSVWRGDMSVIEGDCPSVGYGIPYDTSLTNPLQPYGYSSGGYTSIGQAEPNGVFASTNTAATWVMCVGESGLAEPVYVEAKVTVFPYPVKVDYQNNRVTKAGKASVTINAERPRP
jgi:hypothetical protein